MGEDPIDRESHEHHREMLGCFNGDMDALFDHRHEKYKRKDREVAGLPKRLS